MAATAALLMLVTGCGDPVRPSGATPWSPPATPDPGDATWPDHVALDNETGALAAPGFNALVDTAAPGWAESPETTAAELLDLNTPFDGPIEIYLQQQTEESDSVVTVTLTRLGDDSVEARRFRVVLTRGDDGRYRFVSGEWSQRCHSGRGHRSFAASNCS
ncbi:hypothetical protein GCM10023263_65280 [Phytohabitans rumicis]